jgi:hypothetical protein
MEDKEQKMCPSTRSKLTHLVLPNQTTLILKFSSRINNIR